VTFHATVSHMRDHHLVDYELNLLLAIAGRKPPVRITYAYSCAIETLSRFGYIKPDIDGGYRLTPEGIEVADSVCPEKAASH
jgi:hypothetical protein